MSAGREDETRDAWPFYCEENVWHACARPVREGREAYALFVSNGDQRVAMWSQHAGAPGRPIAWDYHVVLLEHADDGWTVKDPQCRAGKRLPLAVWLDASFRPLPAAAAGFAPLFRLVPAGDFRESFASDRSHMRRGRGWEHPPPPWPAIGEGTNLMEFLDMRDPQRGPVVDLTGLRERLGG